VVFVELEQSLDIEIGHPIAVGKHEAVAADILLDPLHAAAGHGLLSSVLVPVIGAPTRILISLREIKPQL